MAENKEESLEEALALLYERLTAVEEWAHHIENMDPYMDLRVPQYLNCETAAEDPNKIVILDFPADGNATFLINFVFGNNVPFGQHSTITLKYFDEDVSDDEVPELLVYAYSDMPRLPDKLYPGAHANIHTWLELDKNDRMPDEGDADTRLVECVGMTSFGIPKAESPDTSAAISQLKQRIDTLEKEIAELKHMLQDR